MIKMKQIVVAQWTSHPEGVMSYSTIGLGEDGFVYRYDVKCNGWIKYSMKPAECGLEGHRR